MDQPLRQKTCRWCHRLFAICPACDRGHAYCAARCRTLARRRSVQAAKARHQRSPEGRLDHRDHQRAYRARCRVRDHTSPAGSRYARLHARDVSPAPAPEPTRCVVCGRVSRWLIRRGGPASTGGGGMITPAQRAEIRRLSFGEHWKIGTIAAALGVHHETVRAALQHETGVSAAA